MSSVLLVTGGTGLIGGEVILALARDGHVVRAVVRAPTPEAAHARLFARLEKSAAYTPDLRARIHALVGDTATGSFGLAAPGRCSDLTAIIHCAANTQFSEREDACVWNTNVNGATNLVSLARAHAPDARIVFVSTASVTTAPEGSCIDEDTPFGGHANTYTLSKRKAEAIVSASGLDSVILRPSIVLSRGVSDRAMARSILWAVPIMGELGEIPVEADARIDIVPVDHVASCIARIALKELLHSRLYHVSAGRAAHTFGELRREVIRQHPDMARIRPVGRHGVLSSRAQKRLLRPLNAYLPFINAGIGYSNDRLVAELGDTARPPGSVSYVPDLIGKITLEEAMSEMYVP